MKIVLFRDGRPGVAAKLPGEDPEVELTDLLGGETEMTPLNERLTLAALKDGEEMGLPARYRVHRLGRASLSVAGDCAVIAVKQDGMYRDVTIHEIAAADAYVRAVRR